MVTLAAIIIYTRKLLAAVIVNLLQKCFVSKFTTDSGMIYCKFIAFVRHCCRLVWSELRICRGWMWFRRRFICLWLQHAAFRRFPMEDCFWFYPFLWYWAFAGSYGWFRYSFALFCSVAGICGCLIIKKYFKNETQWLFGINMSWKTTEQWISSVQMLFCRRTLHSGVARNFVWKASSRTFSIIRNGRKFLSLSLNETLKKAMKTSRFSKSEFHKTPTMRLYSSYVGIVWFSK